jgi:RHS repeat-associated protein
MVYPSGKRVKYTYDDLARHTGLKEILVNNTEDQLVNNLTYGVAGQLTSMDWKAASNMLMASQTWEYNNRLQMTKYRFNGVGWNGGVSHDYTYSATNNDGKLWRRKDNFSGEEVEYTYDSLHRLATASVLAGTVATDKLWGQQYIYDGFGNMKQKIGHAAAQWTAFNNPLNSQTNGGSGGVPGGDMDGWFYSGTNGYAPDNKRIWNIDKWHLWVGNMRVGTYSVSYDQGTQQYSVTPVKEDWYVAGRRVEPADRLGSNLAGGLRLLPYGEELQPPAVAHGRTKFATYERDAATGMDYADQRWYWPGTGRFTTEDPYEASGGPTEPNSWNRYAYVSGDPVNRNDPKGLYSCNPDPPYTCDGDAESAIWGQMGAGGMGLDWPYALLQLQEEWGSSFPRSPGNDYSGLLTNNGDLISGWDFDQESGSYLLFMAPAAAQAASTICRSQPTLCSLVGGAAVYILGGHISEMLRAARGMQTSRGNIRHDHIREEARERAKAENMDYCDALQAMYEEAITRGDSREAQKIKQQQKADDCRRSRGR